MRVALVQADGEVCKIPNLALMNISAYHKKRGDTVELFNGVSPGRGFDKVYSSKIFKFTTEPELPVDAIRGGTGYDMNGTVAEKLEGAEEAGYDYSLYPEFTASVGFSQRGCRLKCGFCVVPKKEGANVPNATIKNIWRGDPWPKDIVLLDNDFFGQEGWRERAAEIVDGGYRVNLSQGINVRLIDDEGAAWLAKMRYYDGQFKRRQIYTAWDNLGDERVFFRGVDRLVKAGIPARHLCVYMLIGYDPKETWGRLLYRFERISRMGMFAYPMNYDRTRIVLTRFQKWAVRRYFQVCTWPAFRASYKSQPVDLLDDAAKLKLDLDIYGDLC